MDIIQSILPKILLRKGLRDSEQKQLSVLVKQILRKPDDELSSEENFIIGYLNEQDQRYQKAIPFYESAIELNPDFEAAHNNLGICHLELGNLEQALLRFDKALELDPSYFQAILAKAKTLRRLNKANDAIALLETAQIEEGHEDEVYSELSSSYEQNGNKEKSLEFINKALALVSEDANYLAQRALILLFSEKYEEALTDFLKSQKTAGINYVTQFNLGLCYGMLVGRDKDAHQMFTRSFNKFPGLLKDYFTNATEHEKKRLQRQIENIINRLDSMDSSAQGKFYRDELSDILKRKLADALN